MSETIPKSFVEIGDGHPQKRSVPPEYSQKPHPPSGKTVTETTTQKAKETDDHVVVERG